MMDGRCSTQFWFRNDPIETRKGRTYLWLWIWKQKFTTWVNRDVALLIAHLVNDELITLETLETIIGGKLRLYSDFFGTFKWKHCTIVYNSSTGYKDVEVDVPLCKMCLFPAFEGDKCWKSKLKSHTSCDCKSFYQVNQVDYIRCALKRYRMNIRFKQF